MCKVCVHSADDFLIYVGSSNSSSKMKHPGHTCTTTETKAKKKCGTPKRKVKRVNLGILNVDAHLLLCAHSTRPKPVHLKRWTIACYWKIPRVGIILISLFLWQCLYPSRLSFLINTCQRSAFVALTVSKKITQV